MSANKAYPLQFIASLVMAYILASSFDNIYIFTIMFNKEA